MTTFERIENLRKSKGISQGKLEKELGFSNGSISKWKNSMPTSERLQKVADYFGVTTSYLLTGMEEQQRSEISLTVRDERDIAKDLDRIMGEIKKGDDGPLYYNGVEIDDASINLLQNAIEYALRETKKENKVKYNPRKNQK
ncbi:MAG TPA: helix-turn-helix domain-containing protein [Candidatus Eisenbergiella merdavium]|uniref:Helix-turn-helix domain-containing protein n=1 Tax=Candidatus Eisenbergiella merdavium TaxID=2838551 RepID=A0A9D2NGC2_9FIRM|nr:helix-turn-helix domain-containing protein [Candidatus Eisenbergiella merdavium]